MTVMTLFAYGLENGAPEMTVNVSRPQLAEIMHRSIRTVARRIVLAKVLGLMKTTFKGNCNEYVVVQRPCQHNVPADEVTRWAKGRKSGPLELRNDTSSSTAPFTEDTQLRKCVSGHPEVTPTVTPAVAQQGNSVVCHTDSDGVPRNSEGVPRKPEWCDTTLAHSGVIPTGSKSTGVVPTGPDGHTTPQTQTTEVSSSGKEKVSGPVSSGLVIQATKKDIPECQVCQQITGHFPAHLDPDPNGKFCEKHDNPMFR